MSLTSSAKIYKVTLLAERAIPNATVEFGRVNVILGANGAGKSSLLRQLVRKTQDSLTRGDTDLFDRPATRGPRRPVLYVEGGRGITLPAVISHTSDLTTAQLEERLNSARTGPISERLDGSLVLLYRETSARKVRFADAVTAWQRGGCDGPMPEAEDAPLDTVFGAFTRVFPNITLRVDEKRAMVECTKGAGAPYPSSSLSSGEKQVLALLIDVALAASDSVLLVDEPELNLNPQLADRFWNEIEARLPDATFVYATHSLSFALRAGVTNVVGLGPNGVRSLTLTDLSQLDRTDLSDFLGAFAEVVAERRVLLSEGANDKAFDSAFYRWVSGEALPTQTVGDCEAVIRGVRHAGVWGRLRAPSLSVLGVVDRDFRSEAEVMSLESDCIVLRYHEAESYLCHPKLVSELAAKLGRTLSVSDATRDLIRRVERFKLDIAVRRTFARATVGLAVSVDRAALRAAADVETIRQLLEAAANAESQKATRIGPTAVLGIFDEEYARFERALGTADVDELLALAPAKELLPGIASSIGLKNDALTMLHVATAQLRVADFAHLAELRDRILDPARIRVAS